MQNLLITVHSQIRKILLLLVGHNKNQITNKFNKLMSNLKNINIKNSRLKNPLKIIQT